MGSKYSFVNSRLKTFGVIGSIGCSKQHSEHESEAKHHVGHHKPVVTDTSFGNLPNGEQATLYTLTNANGLVVKISNFGGAITSILVPDRAGKNGDIVLGFDTVDGYVDSKSYFGALVGRYANLIDSGKFELNGEQHQLTINDGSNHLHGGTLGFDKVLWAAKPFATDKSVGVVLSHLSADGDQGYPGNLNVIVTYEFNNRNELSITYHATTDKPTPINLTQHPYFNLSTSGTILNHELEINARHYTPVNEKLIPTGEILSVSGTPFDFTNSHKIGDYISENDVQLINGNGYDHNWVLAKDTDIKWGINAKLYDPGSGRMLEVWSDAPGIQFYSANFLDGKLTGKGVAFEHRGALCLEPQSFPDSPNKSSFPSAILQPGSEYSRKIMFKFSAE